MKRIHIINEDSLDYLDLDCDVVFDFVFADIPYPGMTIHDGSTQKLTNKQWFEYFGDLPELLMRRVNGEVAILFNTKEGYEFIFDLYQAFVDAGFILADVLTWLKPTVIPGSVKNAKRFRQAFDFVFVFSTRSKAPTLKLNENTTADERRELNGLSALHLNTVRTMSSGDEAYEKACEETGLKHPGRCPQQLVEYLLQAYTHEDALVLDPFLGSGTTAAACKKLGRRCVGVDVNPDNVKLAKSYVDNVDS